MNTISKPVTEISKIGNSEYLVIELDASLLSTLEVLQSAKFAISTRDLIIESLEYSKARLGNRSPEFFISNDHQAGTISLAKLSKRQKQLLPLLHVGLSNREIASHLSISEHTVKVHLWRFYKKFNVSSRHKLVTAAKLNGLL